MKILQVEKSETKICHYESGDRVFMFFVVEEFFHKRTDCRLKKNQVRVLI